MPVVAPRVLICDNATNAYLSEFTTWPVLGLLQRVLSRFIWNITKECDTGRGLMNLNCKVFQGKERDQVHPSERFQRDKVVWQWRVHLPEPEPQSCESDMAECWWPEIVNWDSHIGSCVDVPEMPRPCTASTYHLRSAQDLPPASLLSTVLTPIVPPSWRWDVLIHVWCILNPEASMSLGMPSSATHNKKESIFK